MSILEGTYRRWCLGTEGRNLEVSLGAYPFAIGLRNIWGEVFGVHVSIAHGICNILQREVDLGKI